MNNNLFKQIKLVVDDLSHVTKKGYYESTTNISHMPPSWLTAYLDNDINDLAKNTLSSQFKDSQQKYYFIYCHKQLARTDLSELNIKKNTIFECYEKNITVVIDASYEPIYASDHEIINKKLHEIKHLIDFNLFIILTCQSIADLQKIEPQFLKLFRTSNTHLYRMYHYYRNSRYDIQFNRYKQYNISTFVSGISKSFRLLLLTQLRRKNINNLIVTHNPLVGWYSIEKEKGVVPSKNSVYFLWYLIEQSGLNIDDISVDKLVSLCKSDEFLTKLKINLWKIEDQKYFIDNIKQIMFSNQITDQFDRVISYREYRNILHENFKLKPLSLKDTLLEPTLHLPNEVINSYLNIVAETQYEIDSFITEKTYRPIFCCVPFLVVGSQRVMQVLHNEGYELYDEIFDYSYEHISDIFKRVDNITDQINLLSKDKYICDIVYSAKEKILYNQYCVLNQAQNLDNFFNTL